MRAHFQLLNCKFSHIQDKFNVKYGLDTLIHWEKRQTIQIFYEWFISSEKNCDDVEVDLRAITPSGVIARTSENFAIADIFEVYNHFCDLELKYFSAKNQNWSHKLESEIFITVEIEENLGPRIWTAN